MLSDSVVVIVPKMFENESEVDSVRVWLSAAAVNDSDLVEL